jgi:hypothetical protein
MKVKLADLPAAVTDVITKIRDGVKAARDAGVIAELPEKVDFQIEVITGYQTLTEIDSTTQTKPEAVTTTVRSGGDQTTEAESTRTVTNGGTTVQTHEY